MAVVVVGSCNVDLVCYTPRLPLAGETLLGSKFAQLWGGKGSNQAVMAARICKSVTMVANVGRDSFGASYLARLREEDINCTHVQQVEGASTGVALIQVDDAGRNTIVVVPGANTTLGPDGLESRCGEVIRQSRVLLCQNEIPMETTVTALRIARAAGVTTVFNPAPAPSWDPLCQEALGLCDILCPNEVELASLTSRPCGTDEEIQLAAQHLLSLGTRTVLVTLGARGACLVTPSSTRFWPARKVDAIDTVGAGDAFIGTLGACIAQERTIEAAIEVAILAAGISVTRCGAQASYPYAHDLPEASL